MYHIEKRQNGQFVELIKKRFSDVKTLATPMKFKKNSNGQEAHKIFMCMEGEIGVGKSTTNNHIIHNHCRQHGIDHVPFSFNYGRQCERVTTSVSTKRPGDLIVMDTPGTNDF